MSEIKIVILDNGTLRVETDEIAGADHVDANALIQFFAKELGGDVSISNKPRPQHKQGEQHVHKH